jgi:hypothetical protein
MQPTDAQVDQIRALPHLTALFILLAVSSLAHAARVAMEGLQRAVGLSRIHLSAEAHAALASLPSLTSLRGWWEMAADPSFLLHLPNFVAFDIMVRFGDPTNPAELTTKELETEQMQRLVGTLHRCSQLTSLALTD